MQLLTLPAAVRLLRRLSSREYYWGHFITGKLLSGCGFGLLGFFFFRFKGIPTNEAVFEERINLLEKKFEGYEAILGKQKYLAGDVSGSPR